MFTPDMDLKPYSRSLENGLVVKSIHNADDVERLAELAGEIHGPSVAALTRHLILDHPHIQPEHWLFAEDPSNHALVSMLCLIPWTWHYETVELRAGELGIVATHPDYRRRGLSRELTRRHHELLHRDGYDLSHIQGIPYFYRQFGYEYALPLEGGWILELHATPDPVESGLTFRQATADDIPALVAFFKEAADDVTISAQRDAATWRYLLGPATQTETSAETWLVLDTNGQPLGYFRILHQGFSEGLILSEASRFTYDNGKAVLSFCKRLAQERSLPYIHLKLPANQVMIQVASNLEARDTGTYAWQIFIPDKGRLLRKLTPVFERRIAESALAGISETYVINLYREAYALQFKDGQLMEVQDLGYHDEGDLRLPPAAFAPLALGWRTLAELNHIYRDAIGDQRRLVDILFPRIESYIYTQY